MNQRLTHICIVVGARPNFIKVAPLLRAFAQHSDVECRLVSTGRTDEASLEPTIFDDLQMPRPDVSFAVDSTQLNEITSRVMHEMDLYLDHCPTDIVIVVDDLASTMAAAIVAKKRGIRLAHLVAGTRSFDIKMPKEINRLVIDALSDYLFTAGYKSNSVAAREQAENAGTFMVGNILIDSLRFNFSRFRKPEFSANAATQHILDGDYIVFTLNRRQLLAAPDKLSAILQALAAGTEGIPIIAPLRENAATVVGQLLGQTTADTSHIHIVTPMNYLEFGWLTAHATGIVTDSGNIAEEATFNGVPCITLNAYTEHQETVTQGTNVLAGEDCQILSDHLRLMISHQWKHHTLPERWDGRTAERIVKILTA